MIETDMLTACNTSVCVRICCSDLSEVLNQLTSDLASAPYQLSGDRRNRLIITLDAINR